MRIDLGSISARSGLGKMLKLSFTWEKAVHLISLCLGVWGISTGLKMALGMEGLMPVLVASTVVTNANTFFFPPPKSPAVVAEVQNGDAKDDVKLAKKKKKKKK